MIVKKERAVVGTVNNDKTISFGTPAVFQNAASANWVCVMMHLLIE